MRILKIAIYTLLTGLFSIFAFSIIREGIMTGDSRGIADILCSIPFVLGLYITVSGIIESIKEKTFKMKIIYGVGLTILGVGFWLNMGLYVFRYIYF